MKRIDCDVAVVGGGVFGLASALELARRGNAVVAFDRFGPGHPATSSTGASRSIRTAYGDPFYVGLARDAIGRWGRLEEATGLEILHLTGQIDLGWPSSLDAIVEAAAAAGGAIEARSNAELRQSMPELSADAGDGLFHREAGTVMAEAGMRALRLATEHAGLRLLAPERATAIEVDCRAVVQSDGFAVEADAVVISAGPWSGELLAGLGIALPLAPAIAQVTFLDAPSLVERPGVAEWPGPGAIGVYGHPVPGVGYKIAFDAGSDGWDADAEQWTPDADEQARITDWLAQRMPGVPRRVAYSQRHPWTMTPDSDWVIDRRGPVVLACGCSGHAFKFGPALGPLVADVVAGGDPLPLFALDRPGMHGAVSASDAIAR
jgi:sarcosine oxidase